MKTTKPAVVTLLFALILGVSNSHAHADPPRVFSVYPPGSHGCVATAITLGPQESLTGLRWVHNDPSTPFPRLLLMEGEPGVAPDLQNTGLILYDLTGDALSWGEVTLDFPVVSSTGTIYAVFVFPADVPTTAAGTGGGPAIGIETAPSGTDPFFLSRDGVEWAQFDRSLSLAVEPVVVSGPAKGSRSAVVLSSLRGEAGYDPSTIATAAPTLPRETRLLEPRPNPFNPRTVLEYDLAAASRVSLKIYDVRGRLVDTLVEAVEPPGRHRAIWEGVDMRGRSVASGVYLIRLETDGRSYTQRAALIR